MSAPAPSRLASLAATAAVFTAATVVMGSIVAATDSSAACPAWPHCYPDQIRPDVVVGWLENPGIEMFHRLVSGLCLVLLAATGWTARRHPDPRLRLYPWIALIGAVAAALFGMMTVLWGLPTPLAMLDLGLALLAMVLAVVTTVAARPGNPGPLRAEPHPSPAAARAGRCALGAIGVLLVMHMLGVVVAGSTQDGYRSFTRVMSWPVFEIVPIDGSPVLQVLRMGLAIGAIALITAAVTVAVRAGFRRGAAIGVAVALVAELVLGASIVAGGFADAQTNGLEPATAVGYSVLASVILVLLAVLAADALAPRGRVGAEPSVPSAQAKVQAATASS